jgi:hypothetical protein
MIAAIIDIVASRKVSTRQRKELDRKLRSLLSGLYQRFQKHCLAQPALTQGDSIELLVDGWQPIVFIFHSLLMADQEFRVGLGTGEVTIQKENADECDGPAFWNAREALDEIKQMKYMSRPAAFNIDENSSVTESGIVIESILFLTTLLSLTRTQLEHCYHFIWEKKSISEIAETIETSKGNVSRSLSKTPCYLLERVMAYLSSSRGP